MKHHNSDHETILGRKLERLRWRDGRLQQCFAEQYERYDRGRYLCGGIREVWEDVPGGPPAADQPSEQPKPPTE